MSTAPVRFGSVALAASLALIALVAAGCQSDDGAEAAPPDAAADVSAEVGPGDIEADQMALDVQVAEVEDAKAEEVTADAAPDTARDVQDVDDAVDTTDALGEIIFLGDPYLSLGGLETTDEGGDGDWNAGESLHIDISITNDSDLDFENYPGVRLEASHPGITINPPEANFFVIFAGVTMVAAFDVTMDDTVMPLTSVTFTATISALGCGTAENPCPQPSPIQLQIVIAP